MIPELFMIDEGIDESSGHVAIQFLRLLRMLRLFRIFPLFTFCLIGRLLCVFRERLAGWGRQLVICTSIAGFFFLLDFVLMFFIGGVASSVGILAMVAQNSIIVYTLWLAVVTIT